MATQRKLTKRKVVIIQLAEVYAYGFHKGVIRRSCTVDIVMDLVDGFFPSMPVSFSH